MILHRMAPNRAVDPAGVARVLIVRPRFLGDLCLALPVLDAVRAACPAARVGWIVEQDGAPLLEGDPRIDALFVVPRSLGAGGTIRLVRRLRRFAPEVVIDLFCNPRTALWTLLTGARVRVGYPHKGLRSGVYTHHSRPRTLSAIGFHLASVETLGWPAPYRVPELHVSEAARTEAQAALSDLGVSEAARLVGFHPGARWPTRRWHPERFAELARRFLAADSRGVALVSGGPGETELVERVIAALPQGRAHAILGWPIARFVALQARCVAFVAGDTGPLHLAVAAGARTLGLLSRNRPAMFFPYPPEQGHRAHYARVECSPCDRDQCPDLRCLERLTVDGAWALLAEMLASAR